MWVRQCEKRRGTCAHAEKALQRAPGSLTRWTRKDWFRLRRATSTLGSRSKKCPVNFSDTGIGIRTLENGYIKPLVDRQTFLVGRSQHVTSTWEGEKSLSKSAHLIFWASDSESEPSISSQNTFFTFLGAAIDPSCHAATGPPRAANSVRASRTLKSSQNTVSRRGAVLDAACQSSLIAPHECWT